MELRRPPEPADLEHHRGDHQGIGQQRRHVHRNADQQQQHDARLVVRRSAVMAHSQHDVGLHSGQPVAGHPVHHTQRHRHRQVLCHRQCPCRHRYRHTARHQRQRRGSASRLDRGPRLRREHDSHRTNQDRRHCLHRPRRHARRIHRPR